MMVAVLGVLAPLTAQARGRRTVPSLRSPTRVVPGPASHSLTTVGLTVHLASRDGVPIASRRTIEQWVARANWALKPHGLFIELHAIEHLAGYTAVTRHRDRRELAIRAEHDGTIHMFVTETLDPPTPLLRRRVRGLHWRYHGLGRELRQREFVIVTLGAPKTTFVHEVGHLLGLRHSNREDNIMCSCRRGANTRFTPEQGSLMRQGVGRFTARHRQAQARTAAQRVRWARRSQRR